jgi:hypothetical protein
MTEKLTIQAGEKALELIREKGLTKDMVKVIAGAAGGPKWIVLSGLDRYLFGHFFTDLKAPVHLIGSSIGAYRFAAVMTKNPDQAIRRFLYAYIRQSYRIKPTPQYVTDTSLDIIHAFLDDNGMNDVLNHPFFRLNVMVARCKSLTADEKKSHQLLGFAAAFLGNLASRKTLGWFMERTLFHDQRDIAPFFSMNGLPIRQIPLSRENIKPAILASGAIPIVMAGVADIPGTSGGMYRDGGVIDYHMDIPYGINDGIVLFPHYTDRVTPGWLDKSLIWRKPNKDHMAHVLMVSPSRSFLKDLPYAKIPDRNDFFLFKGDDKGRFDYWQAVAEKSREMADEFHEVVESGRIRELVKPFEL